jgi:hypothetical protein
VKAIEEPTLEKPGGFNQQTFENLRQFKGSGKCKRPELASAKGDVTISSSVS